MSNKTIYVSPNQKWGIQAYTLDEDMSSFTVVDKVSHKRHYVSVEHIKKGMELLAGGYADKDEHSMIGAERLPAYVKKEILSIVEKESV